MKYLLDTCAISELLEPEPNKQVTDWIEDTDESSLYVSVLTIGELCKGINKLPDSKKKTEIRRWMKYDFHHRFKGRILEINEKIAETWGEIQADAERQGRKMPAIDSLLATHLSFPETAHPPPRPSPLGIPATKTKQKPYLKRH